MTSQEAIQQQKLRQAATILADAFSHSVLPRLEKDITKTWLYSWEQKALNWLKEWRPTDPGHPINYWTWSYMEYGPPPWKDKQ